jgi:hypothetical protein
VIFHLVFKNKDLLTFEENKSFSVNKIDWSKDGATMLLFDKVIPIRVLIKQSDLVIAYPPADFLVRNPTYESVDKRDDDKMHDERYH